MQSESIFRYPSAFTSHLGRSVLCAALLSGAVQAQGGNGHHNWNGQAGPTDQANGRVASTEGNTTSSWGGGGRRYVWAFESPAAPHGKDRLVVHARNADVQIMGRFADNDTESDSYIDGGANSVDHLFFHQDHKPEDEVSVTAFNSIRFRSKYILSNGVWAMFFATGHAIDIFGKIHEYAHLGLVAKDEQTWSVEVSNSASASAAGVAAGLNANGNTSAGSNQIPGHSVSASGSVSASASASTSSDTQSNSGRIIQGQSQANGEAPSINFSFKDTKQSCAYAVTIEGQHSVFLGGKGGDPHGVARAICTESLTRNDVSFSGTIITTVDDKPGDVIDDTQNPGGNTVVPGGEEPLPDPKIFLESLLRWLNLGIVNARGLQSETGSDAGALFLALDAPLDQDVEFALSVSQPGVLDLPATLVFPAGNEVAMAEFTAIGTGAVTVYAELLDVAGAPTGEVMTASLDVSSLAAIPAPGFRARWGNASIALEDGMPTMLASNQLGGMRVERSGFAGIDTSASQVQVLVEDPAGIFSKLPNTKLVIPAGETGIDLDLELSGVAGEAVVTLLTSDGELSMPLRTRSQEWAFPVPVVSVPVGAQVDLGPNFAHRADQEQELIVSSSDPTVVSVMEGQATQTMPAFATFDLASFRAESLGSSLVEFRTMDGVVEPASLMVQVLPSTIEVNGAEIQMSAMQGSQAGRIVLGAPYGQTWGSFDAPQGSSDYLEVSGVGTGVIVLDFLPEQQRPEYLDFGFTLEGEPELESLIEIDDLLHDSGDTRCRFRLEVEQTSTGGEPADQGSKGDKDPSDEGQEGSKGGAGTH